VGFLTLPEAPSPSRRSRQRNVLPLSCERRVRRDSTPGCPPARRLQQHAGFVSHRFCRGPRQFQDQFLPIVVILVNPVEGVRQQFELRHGDAVERRLNSSTIIDTFNGEMLAALFVVSQLGATSRVARVSRPSQFKRPVGRTIGRPPLNHNVVGCLHG
jgi:hypothetical protein